MSTLKIIAFTLIGWFISQTSMAQVSTDSIKLLNQQKGSLKIQQKINENKLKLAALENTLEKQTREKEDAATNAQKAASENQEAASKLNGDPQDKKLARRAEKAGNAARKSARRAREKSDDLDDTMKKIESLRKTISDDEKSLPAN